METQALRNLNVLDDAQDVVAIRPSGENSYVYAVKPSLDVHRRFYERSVSNPDDSNVSAFSGWYFDEKRGIESSSPKTSTFLALRLDKKALRPDGLWVPGLLEEKVLRAEGKLQKGIYRNYGLIVYSNGVPNEEIAQSLVPQAEQLGLELPLVVPFSSLDYVIVKNRDFRVDVSFVESPVGVISGKEAIEQIDSLGYKADSGVHWLNRGRVGGWVADWYFKGIVSNFVARVDWVCGKATRVDLERAHDSLMEREYSERIRKLGDEKKTKQLEFVKSLSF